MAVGLVPSIAEKAECLTATGRGVVFHPLRYWLALMLVAGGLLLLVILHEFILRPGAGQHGGWCRCTAVTRQHAFSDTRPALKHLRSSSRERGTRMDHILGLSVGPLGMLLTQTFRGRSEGINWGGLSSNLMSMATRSHFGSMAKSAQWIAS